MSLARPGPQGQLSDKEGALVTPQKGLLLPEGACGRQQTPLPGAPTCPGTSLSSKLREQLRTAEVFNLYSNLNIAQRACASLTAAEGVGAAGAVLPGEELAARLPRLGRLAASPLPVVELLPIGLLAAPQHGHRAPGLLHHLHDAVQRLQARARLRSRCPLTRSPPGFLIGGTVGTAPGKRDGRFLRRRL